VKQQWIERPEGGTAVGYRLIVGIARFFGRTVARAFLYPITLYFVIRRGPERRASRDYLRRVFGKEPTIWQISRHVFTFAAVILDRVFLLSENYKRFDVRVHGVEQLRDRWSRGKGVLVFGAHVGSFEALRIKAEQRQGLKLRPIIDLEQNPALSRILNALNPKLAASIINARQDGTTTALAIKEALDEGAIVTLLAERARPGNTVVPVEFLGQEAPFPTAPWQLAAALKVPVVLCFGLYRGGNRYDLHFEVFEEQVLLERKNREQGLRVLAQRFAQRLEHHVRIAPYNWFNFYDFWNPHAPRSGSDDVSDTAASDSGQRP
jgi:predicted LPLAT superfamily acyltransferase